jgi:TonB family protein
MNTAEFDTGLRHQRRPERPEQPRLQAVTTAPIAIAVQSTDRELCEAIRAAAGNQHPVSIAASMEEAMQLAAEGRCGILITDQALTQHALVQIGKQVRTYDPATITIAVGSRGDDNALIGLLSSAVVERFMLKPVTPSLARLVIRSAASEYQSLKYRARREPAAPQPEPPVEHSGEPVVVPVPGPARVQAAPTKGAEPAQEPTRVAAAPIMIEPRAWPAADAAGPSRSGFAWHVWLIAAAAALVVGAAVWWTMQSRIPDIDPRQVIAANLAAARQALDVGHYVEPPESSALHFYSVVLSLDAANAEAKQGMEAVAQRMIEDVKLAIVDGRLAEAGIALERLRRISSDKRRLAVLDGELRKEQAGQIARLQSPLPAAPQVQPTAAPVASVSKAPARRKTPVATPAPQEEETLPAVIPVAMEGRASTANPLGANPLDWGPPAPVEANRAGAVPGVDAERAETIAPPVIAAPVVVPAASEKAVEPAEPKLVKMVQPDFPKEALERDIQGWVDLTLAVTASGKVASARVNDAENGRFFERAAMSAVKQWQYAPDPAADPAMTQPVRVRVSFKLQD